LALVAVLWYAVMHTEVGQDAAFARLAKLAMKSGDTPSADALEVFVCGSSSPLPDINRAQACIAIVTPENFFIVDAGAGSAVNVLAANLPLARLQGLLLTHFHSDHIASIYDMNLNSWVQGRPKQLAVYGPNGVETVVAGINEAYALDRSYRVKHHGAALLPPELGLLAPIEVTAGDVLQMGSLKITVFATDHSPVSPSVGYRFDYKGRSVVVTGDTIITPAVAAAVQDLDVLVADAMSIPIVTAMESAAKEAGRDRVAKILGDIQTYHAPVADVSALARKAGVRLTVLYHMVPPPRNALMENIYEREAGHGVILSHDRMWIVLPANETGYTLR
ncbi:MAG: MBL fold metallo-hydrolase, partial [Pseudomonadales bacterium]|nr:MBL fold metallo-hydrolase [Pseudomonadales bacterium]